MNKIYLCGYLLLTALALKGNAETIHANNSWNLISGLGHFTSDSSFFWEINTQMRFNMQQPLFRQNLNTFRLGRNLNEYFDYSVAFQVIPIQLADRFINEQRIWQQIDVHRSLTSSLILYASNRIETRWIFESSGLSMRDRFRLILKQCQSNKTICPYLGSETFINMNRVTWDMSKTLAQERISIGIEKTISKAVRFQIGYLNQYIWGKNLNSSFDVIDLRIFMVFN